MSAHNALWGHPVHDFGEYYIDPEERRRRYQRIRYARLKARHGIADQTSPKVLAMVRRLREYLEANGTSQKTTAMKAIGKSREDEVFLATATYLIPLCEEDDGRIFLDTDARF